jgi:aryl-alcohol dehydrogenase-like predicted oxidoreductase
MTSLAAELAPWLTRREDPTDPVRIALGTMNFGKRTDEATSIRIVRRALERGVTLFDTANVYSDGASEAILGRALGADRARVLVATKVGLLRRDGRPEGLSPATIARAVDESLARLGMDHVDVCYLHAPDPKTPWRASLDAMEALVERGKVRAVGVSNHASWQILEMLTEAKASGRAAPAVSQVLYNVLVRQIEIEHLAFAAAYGIHVTVYNALAGGLLTGKHQRGLIPRGSRFENNRMYQERYLSDRMFDLVDALSGIAAEHGMSMTELSYAWLAGRRGVDSILIGPATVEHLDAALDGCEKRLPGAAVSAVDALYRAFQGTDARYARLG